MKQTRKAPTAVKRGDSWRCQVMVEGTRMSFTGATADIAIAKAMAWKSGAEAASTPLEMLTVGAAVDRYIESKDSVLSPSTVAGYKRIRDNALKGIDTIKLRDLTQEKVQNWVNGMAKDGKSPKTIRNSHGLLSAALAEYRPNFTLRTTLPQKEKYDVAIPSYADVSKIFKQIKGTEDELPFLLAVWLGLRISEIRGLMFGDLKDGVLRIRRAMVDEGIKTTKTYSSQRDLICPPYIQELINAQPRTSEFIVPYSRRKIANRFYTACEKAGVQHYRFHDLRHINASVMLALGVPDKYAMERMGHSSNNMLKTVYQHTMNEQAEAFAKMVDTQFETMFFS